MVWILQVLEAELLREHISLRMVPAGSPLECRASGGQQPSARRHAPVLRLGCRV